MPESNIEVSEADIEVSGPTVDSKLERSNFCPSVIGKKRNNDDLPNLRAAKRSPLPTVNAHDSIFQGDFELNLVADILLVFLL